LLLTKKQLTTGQKLALQRKAQEQHVEVKFDPKDYDAVRLYLYAYEMSMSSEIQAELKRKAKSLAKMLPTKLNHVGILVDVSESMMGHRTQKRRPIAVALAIRDVLIAASKKASICYSNGKSIKDFDLIEPAGETVLVEGLVTLLKEKPDSIFILTDGYENTPAGRLNEAIIAARRIGVDIPIYQISPVMAAEALGVRALSEEIPIFPLNQPEAIGLGMVKLMMLKDVDRAIAALLNLTLPLLEGTGRTILLTSSVI
ncbi:MAG: VWA domain-containing protein, partial [bacterium]